MNFNEIPVGDEQLAGIDDSETSVVDEQLAGIDDSELFEIGDQVDVLANTDDPFNDFCGTVIGYKGSGIVQVRDQDDDVWDVGENQCQKFDE